MFLSEEEIKLRVESPDNLINIIELDVNRSYREEQPEVKVVKWAGSGATGRSIGALGLTEEERIAAGVLSRTLGNEIAAETFGITKQHASNISNGNASISKDVARKIDERIGLIKNDIEEKAAERLLKALGCLDDDKIANSTAKDISTIVTNMSKTMANMRGNIDAKNQGPKVQVILYNQKPAKEEHFEVIEVSA